MLRNVLKFLGILALIRIFLRIFFCPPSNRPIWPKTLTPEERKALRRISSAAALSIKDVCAPSPKLRSTQAAAKLVAKHVSEPHMKTREMLITNNIFVCGPKKPTCNDDETEGFVSGSWAKWARRPPRPRCRKGPPAKTSPAITHIAIPQPGVDLSDPYNLRGISGSYGNSKGVQVPSLSMLAMAPRARATTSLSVFLGKERLTTGVKTPTPPPSVSPVFEPSKHISRASAPPVATSRVRRSPTSISRVLEPPSSISRVLPPPTAIPQVVKSPKSGSGILQPPSSISQVLESPTAINQPVMGPSTPGTPPEEEEVDELMEVSEPSVAIASCAPRGVRARLRARRGRLLRRGSPHPRVLRSARRPSAGRGRSADSQASGEHTARKVRKVNRKRHYSHSCDRSVKIARTI